MADNAERAKLLFQMFKDAVEGERRAQKIYQEAAALCDDPSLKKILQDIRRDEQRHEEELVRRYALLREQYGFPATAGNAPG